MKNNSHMAVVRERLGITQQTLAEMLGVDRKYISMIETGVKPLSKKLSAKLDQVSQIVFRRRETVGVTLPDGTQQINEVRERGDPYLALPSQWIQCPACKKKDKEIAFLRGALKKAIACLPTPVNNDEPSKEHAP